MNLDEQVLEHMLAHIEDGIPLKSACQLEGIPDVVILRKYLRDNPTLMEKYNQAKAAQHARIASDPQFANRAHAQRRKAIEEKERASKSPGTN